MDNYGKLGILWHGWVMISYYAIEEVDIVNFTVLRKTYIDHVMDNESKQKVTAVFAILEFVVC